MEEYYNPKIKRDVKIIGIVITVLFLIIATGSIIAYNVYKNQIYEGILLYGQFGIFISSALFELIPQVLNPFLVLMVGIASGINPITSTVLTILGSALGSVVGFELGLKYGPRIIYTLVEKKNIEKIFLYWGKYGKFVVTVSALTPVPFLPIVFGALKMKRMQFIIYGIVVRCLSFVVIGYAFTKGFF